MDTVTDTPTQTNPHTTYPRTHPDAPTLPATGVGLQPLARLYPCRVEGEHVFYNDVCDGHSDCSDGADESQCRATDFPAATWPCVTSSDVIHTRQRCDGQFHCRDKSDEEICYEEICAKDKGMELIMVSSMIF